MPFDTVLLLPGQDGIGGQLGAVVADDHAGTASQFDDPIELAHDPQARERGIHHQPQALSGEVIDQGQNAKATAAHQRVGHEVERPAQIAILRDRHRRPRAKCPFATTAPANAQPLLLVEPVELLVIELDALALQHQPEPAITEPASLRSQLAQSNAKLFIARPL